MYDSEAGAGGPHLVRVDEKLEVVAFEAELLAKLEADKRLVLAGMNPIVLEVSGFDRMLTIEPDLATARARHG